MPVLEHAIFTVDSCAAETIVKVYAYLGSQGVRVSRERMDQIRCLRINSCDVMSKMRRRQRYRETDQCSAQQNRLKS